ncbi:STAS/SEC14 domain-containing protein [Sphingomonas sp. YR710]|uniref:STAS/SEC14 domain-containing protein n=1 Tax=Sphingomonas sp. YR710 TaxID=1882773 RepID=UPI00115F999F|nr:STAS/SEC14 domain-containing protein [Sphingomonas sp. YR710]
MLTLEYDAELKIIKGVSAGFLTVEDVEDYAQKLARLTCQARESDGVVRLCLDSRESLIQSQEVMAAFACLPSMISSPSDRVAVVVSSSLAKLQMKRNFNSQHERTFTSVETAVAWLRSD